MIKLGVQDQARGGLPLDEGVRMAQLLAADGVDAIEISEGVEEEPIHHIRTGVDSREKEAYYLEWARAVRAAVTAPLFLVGGLRSFDLMEGIVEEGVVDCVSLCRPFIRQPDLVHRYRRGELDMVTCISCNGCLKNLQAGKLECIFDDA
jgi:2,4-dienoyl-CoA reductase-like NADH-dependent reductase (Old Yellow Enzyme family)